MTTDSSTFETPTTDSYFTRLNGKVRTLDPVAAANDASETVIQQLFDTLTTHEQGRRGDLVLSAATAVETSEDDRTYRFTLDPDARFHDDEFGAVTADDVVYSFERLAGSPNSVRAAYILDTLGVKHETDEDGQYVHGTLGVEALSEDEVEIQLQEPFHSALDVLAHTSFSIVPEGIVGDVPSYDGDREYEAFARAPVGSGPFAFESWVEPEASDGTGGEMLVERFEEYHGEVASVPGVHWLTTLDTDTHHERVLDETIDMFGIPTEHYDRDRVSVDRVDENGRRIGQYDLEDGSEVQYIGNPTLGTYYLGFNTDTVERPLRRAVAAAIDQERLVSEVFADRVIPATHLTPPSLFPGGDPAYRDHAAERPSYDEQRAEVDAETLHLASTVALDWGGFGDRLEADLAEIGVELTTERITSEELAERGKSGDLEAFVLGWGADWPAADGVLQILDPERSRSTADSQLSYFEWDGTDAAERASAAWDRIRDNRGPGDRAASERAAAYETIEAANWEDVCLIPLYHNVEEFMWRDWVDSPYMGTMGGSRQKYNTIELASETTE